MASTTDLMAGILLLLLMASAPATAQKAPLTPSPSPSPAPAPAPHLVNLTHLLSVAGPFSTFLRYLQQTDVISTFQNQVNNTDQGITIFAPTDAAFSSLKKPSLANLTRDQLRSLLLSHALPQYYSLAEFRNLSQRNPVTTFAGGQYTLNFSDASGLVRVDSGWANPRISSSVISTDPVAVYEVKNVLLPVAIFGAAPPPAPAPAPAPDLTKPSDLAPSAGEAGGSSSPRSANSPDGSSSCRVDAGTVGYFLLALVGEMMLRL
ncbi:hypothetical protein Taro_053232 [Colocasia esculenta]|uniref:FAS1 domain-containing protein n=1 Tax=Colocasia esculenta TaxID=4460 RepID=A0A843XLK8_COLES|nr:hypothetical protein [Colocasia esculenta]